MRYRLHIFQIITYICTLFVFLLAAVFYRQPFLVMLFILLFVLPFFSIITTYRAFHKLSFQLLPVTDSVTAGNDVKIKCIGTNASPFTLFSANLTFSYTNMYYDCPPPFSVRVTLRPGKKTAFPVEFVTKKAGMLRFTLTKITLNDYLNLIEFTNTKNISSVIPVFPEKTEFTLPEYTLGNEGFDEVDESTRKGHSTHDITGIRPYIPGDRLSYIHWKLSAKNDEELMVKELSSLSERKLVVFPMLTQNSLQKVLSIYYSLGLKLNSINEQFVLRYYNSSMNEPVECTVNNEDELIKSLIMLYYVSIPENFDYPDIPEYLLTGCSVLFAGSSVTSAEY